MIYLRDVESLILFMICLPRGFLIIAAMRKINQKS